MIITYFIGEEMRLRVCWKLSQGKWTEALRYSELKTLSVNPHYLCCPSRC